MPQNRPAASGYARLAQAEDENVLEDSDEESDPHRGLTSLSSSSRPQYAQIQPSRQPSRMQSNTNTAHQSRKRSNWRNRQRSNSGVDIKAINARLERWADEIAQKFKIRKGKGKSFEEEQLEIHHSVFQAPEWIRPATAETLSAEYSHPSEQRMTKLEYDDIVESVKVAIELGTHPKLISQGSSGSYFARNSQGKVVAVFKPKNEEPYASMNPKWTKWIHRNLFPFFFGRACLIPNLSYVSEAAAYVLDTQLRTHIVPYTDIVSLSSKSFYYDFWDRRAYYRKKKPFPEKIGSFQVFLKGFRDANIFLKEHPWPDQQNSLNGEAVSRRSKRSWTDNCRPSGARSDDEDDDFDPRSHNADEERRRKVFWTEQLQQSFREQLEKLVVLDYIMRNTDRGLDNWMIKINTDTQKATITAEAPKSTRTTAQGSDDPDVLQGPQDPYRRENPMSLAGRGATPLVQSRNSPSTPGVTASLGAIDNSLSWPWKHPDAWRSYPFGWLFLPVSLIGQPFSEATRRHFLPLLTSKDWWSETQLALRRCFSQDADFKERMFAKQMAVMKGQAWNVVEALKTPDHGPLELTRRARVCVWDDVVDIPVAVPLRMPSEQMRNQQYKQSRSSEETEEMDISAAHPSASVDSRRDNITGSPGSDMEENPFNTSRQAAISDSLPDENVLNGNISPSSSKTVSWETQETRSVRPKSKMRFSYDERRRPQDIFGGRSKRRLSLSHNRRSSVPFLFGDDDLEGDLGYAAAEDMEGNQKRVIVERLENVKAKNPVFTWC